MSETTERIVIGGVDLDPIYEAAEKGRILTIYLPGDLASASLILDKLEGNDDTEFPFVIKPHRGPNTAIVDKIGLWHFNVGFESAKDVIKEYMHRRMAADFREELTKQQQEKFDRILYSAIQEASRCAELIGSPESNDGLRSYSLERLRKMLCRQA